jgi:hypothetical protein
MAACRRQFRPGWLDKARISGSQLCSTDTCSLEFSYPLPAAKPRRLPASAVHLVPQPQAMPIAPLADLVALLAWSAGLMDSTNFRDYLLDPWLAIAALVQCLKAGGQRLLHRFRRISSASRPSSA